MKMRISGYLAVLLSLSLAACVADVKTSSGEGAGKGSESEADIGSGNGDGSEVDAGNDDKGDGSETDVGSGNGSDPGKDTDLVEVPEARVSFLSPANGATVTNPVSFSIAASNVSTVQIEVDEWPLSPSPWDPSTKTTLEYKFSGTGFERTAVLFGFDAQGLEVARDTIRLTVKDPAVVQPPPPPPPPGKGTSIGTFINTYYYIEEESAHTGAATATFYDRNCGVLAKVPASFASLACIEGTAKLKNGSVINYATNKQCGGPCKFTWAVMDPARFPWGQGNRGNALEPLRSWAVDTNVIANGTVLYVEEWDGKAIPKIGTIGGSTHDGCFRADDVGGGIKGKHVDIFAGSIAMYRELNRTFPTRTSFTVYKDSPRCAHLRK